MLWHAVAEMRRFTQLYTELDETTRTTEKLAALGRYFAEAPPEDAAWALYFLTGHRIQRAVTGPQLRQWAAEASGYPVWLVEESHEAAGDLAEAIALIIPEAAERPEPPTLHALVEERLVPLKALPEEERRELLIRTWRELGVAERLVWNKLITGEFRVGVARTLVVRALAALAGVEAAEMAHRLMGEWSPTGAAFEHLLTGDHSLKSPGHPYPFFLAYPIEGEPGAALGERAQWQAEWKWDGIRAQLIRRRGQLLLWSRGEELVTDRFPEVAHAGALLPEGTVLDGEILAWHTGAPLPFGHLQRRIGRKVLSAQIMAEVPVGFMAFDLLEAGGEDWRERPLRERRARLEALIHELPPHGAVHLSPVIDCASWEELACLREESRERAVEGVMLKRLESPYRVGRVRGDWWKWKIEPHTVDAVLMYAQHGHGRRATLYTDYTFGVWKNGLLVPVAKAYSGLTDEEIREVDAFIRANTIDRHGPVRVVRQELVFELAFEGIQPSPRHKAGVALRFPRMARWRRDKLPGQADSIETLRALLPGGGIRG